MIPSLCSGYGKLQSDYEYTRGACRPVRDRDMWCLFFSLKTKKIVKHINYNNISVVNTNEKEKEYDNVSYTIIQVVDDMLYEPSGET